LLGHWLLGFRLFDFGLRFRVHHFVFDLLFCHYSAL
jgi:hypothetical protein